MNGKRSRRKGEKGKLNGKKVYKPSNMKTLIVVFL